MTFYRSAIESIFTYVVHSLHPGSVEEASEVTCLSCCPLGGATGPSKPRLTVSETHFLFTSHYCTNCTSVLLTHHYTCVYGGTFGFVFIVIYSKCCYEGAASNLFEHLIFNVNKGFWFWTGRRCPLVIFSRVLFLLLSSSWLCIASKVSPAPLGCYIHTFYCNKVCCVPQCNLKTVKEIPGDRLLHKKLDRNIVGHRPSSWMICQKVTVKYWICFLFIMLLFILVNNIQHDLSRIK